MQEHDGGRSGRGAGYVDDEGASTSGQVESRPTGSDQVSAAGTPASPRLAVVFTAQAAGLRATRIAVFGLGPLMLGRLMLLPLSSYAVLERPRELRHQRSEIGQQVRKAEEQKFIRPQ